MNLLDPAKIAQFFAMPGATELVEAFAAIPPGPVRDSIVVHAQTLAHASTGWTPTQVHHADNPPKVAWVGSKLIPAPAAPTPWALATSSDGQIVERALRGEKPTWIAAQLSIDVEVVYRLMEKARKEGGIEFPGDESGQNHSKASKLMQKIRGEQKPPPPPWWWENPHSPIWDQPDLLPGKVDAKGSMAAQGPMSAMAHKAMSHAAARRGVTLRQHVAERIEIVRRARSGERPTEIAEAMGWQPFNVYGLLAQVGFSATDAAKQFDRPIVNTGGRPKNGVVRRKRTPK